MEEKMGEFEEVDVNTLNRWISALYVIDEITGEKVIAEMEDELKKRRESNAHD